MRKIIFSLIFFLLLSSTGSAFQDDVESYSSYATYYTTSNLWAASVVNDPLGIPDNSVLAMRSSNTIAGYLVPSYTLDPSYFSFIFHGASDAGGLCIQIRRPTDSAVMATITDIVTTTTHSNDFNKIEVLEVEDTFTVYVDGVYLKSAYNAYPTWEGEVKFCPGWRRISPASSSYGYVDDLTDSSVIGTATTHSEAEENFTFTWSAQLLRSYETQYTISMYSLSNPDNAGKVIEWDIPQDSLSSAVEHGYISFNRASTLGPNFGLYLFEISRGSVILTDVYVMYSSLASPQNLPEILLLAESDVSAEIRDDSNNGGEIAGGGSVYLYPAEITGGVYNVSYNILETPYSIQAELTKIYNTTDLDGTNLLFSGLSSMNYYVSVDGTAINGTNGSDTWNYTVIWDTLESHIVTFAPDYTLPGVYGYIKNSETQAALKSSTVSISNGSFTKYLFTDNNGMYYLTKEMSTGSYNVTASKSGYTSSVPYQVTTQNGSTTRQDIWLDPIEGAGVYYAAHDVTFTVLEYWYSSVGLQDVTYTVYDDENETVKTGITGTKGTFSVKDMDQGIKYTIVLTYNGNTYTEYIEPGLTEYNLVLNKEGIVHEYYNNWLTLTYAETPGNVSVIYDSNKTITEASLTVTASNGTIVQAETLNTTSGTFTFSFTDGDYTLQFNIEASDGSTASQVWTISYPSQVTLFPASYPTWLKNTLFVAIIIIFLLAFGKSKNDIACGAVAVLTSLGYYFQWLTCSFNFVVLIWIIAIGAIYLHYKRTGAVG
jgi:hypothetical protein